MSSVESTTGEHTLGVYGFFKAVCFEDKQEGRSPWSLFRFKDPVLQTYAGAVICRLITLNPCWLRTCPTNIRYSVANASKDASWGIESRERICVNSYLYAECLRAHDTGGTASSTSSHQCTESMESTESPDGEERADHADEDFIVFRVIKINGITGRVYTQGQEGDGRRPGDLLSDTHYNVCADGCARRDNPTLCACVRDTNVVSFALRRPRARTARLQHMLSVGLPCSSVPRFVMSFTHPGPKKSGWHGTQSGRGCGIWYRR